MERIKTNIVELSKLRKEPCRLWLIRFDATGKIDASEAFKKYPERYAWLYENSNYDLIGWEIENGVFDWKNNCWAVAKYCPEYFDGNKYNWKDFSLHVAMYCPENLDPEKFNWDDCGWAVAKYCPDKLDPERYNWVMDGWAVAMYCPDRLVPEKYNWKFDEWAVVYYCPEKLKLKPQGLEYIRNT